MIPRIIHQTWKNDQLPEPLAWPHSWRAHNPGWDYRLWTDADLLALVQGQYPALESLYRSYPNPVQRADLGRYLILQHCGGLYADLDTECLAPVEVLAAEDRVVLCEEPVEHRHHSQPVGLPRLLFNGVMASPQGHPFWDHLLAVLGRCRHARRWVLESTGPLLLTGAVDSYDTPGDLAISSCHLFAPLTFEGRESTAPVQGDHAGLRLSNHYWRSTWFVPEAKTQRRVKTLKRLLRKARYRLSRGPVLDRSVVAAGLDMTLLHRPVAPREDRVAVLIPVRDAAPFLERCFDLLLALDYPKDRLRLVFCEGDSRDDTLRLLESLADRHRGRFGGIEITRCVTGAALDRAQRWRRRLQYQRRSNLARVRNHLIDHGLTAGDGWALWVDADVCDYPSDVLSRLLAEGRKVVAPDCRLDRDGPSYDLNSFLEKDTPRGASYYKHVRGGLFMPPATTELRRHLHDFRFLDRVPLSSVGGTMLLVHGSVHRAGLRFPERPYDDLLETEGFGRMCRDFGILPIGLPNLTILHHRS